MNITVMLYFYKPFYKSTWEIYILYILSRFLSCFFYNLYIFKIIFLIFLDSFVSFFSL